MNNYSPIVLFAYNRLDELKRTCKYLQKNNLASHSDLYIFSDGPKNDADKKKIQNIRKYIKAINGFKKITISEHNQNKGLANSIIEGVSKVIHQYGKVIVIEDDLITSPNFLDFMNQALSFYENDSEIFSVSGYTLDLPSMPSDKDFYFGYRASSWGWGCWKDQWEKVDWEVSDFEDFIKDRSFRKKFNRGGSDMTKMLQNQQEGKIDSWAIRFCYHQYKYDLKTVFPTISKVQSIGFSNDATHTVGIKRFTTPLDNGEQREFNFEKFQNLDVRLVKEFQNKFSIKTRAFDKFRRILGI